MTASRPPKSPTAAMRFQRIVSIVPWIAQRHGPTIAEVCDRFQIDRAELLEDLEVIFMVGVPPYTPDELIDVVIDDDRIYLTLGSYFYRPLRLTAAEALGLLTSAQAALAVADPAVSSSLIQAVDKLGDALSTSAPGLLTVSLAGGSNEISESLKQSQISQTSVRIRYYSLGSDSYSTRVIDPWLLYSAGGATYVYAWCHNATSTRSFRLDRIESVEVTKQTFDKPDNITPPELLAGDELAQIVIDLAPEAVWVAHHYPVVEVADTADGHVLATMKASTDSWLARLMMRLGTNAAIVGDEAASLNARDSLCGAIDRVLQRYESNEPLNS